MDWLSYLHFAVFLLLLMASAYILRKNFHMALNRVGAALFFSMALYSFSFVFITAPIQNVHLFQYIIHIASIGSFATSLFTLWIALIISKKYSIAHHRAFHISISILIGVIAILQFQGYLAYPVEKDEYGFWIIFYKHFGLYIVTNLIINLNFLAAFVILFLHIRRETAPQSKKQSKIILIAAILTVVLSNINLAIHNFAPEPYYIPLFVNFFLLILCFAVVYVSEKLEMFEIIPSELAKTIIEMLPSGLIMANEQGRVILVNKMFCILTNSTKNQWINKPIPEVLSRITLQKPSEAVLIHSKLRQQIQINPVSKQPQTILFSSKHIKDKDNKTTCIICIFENITELKFYENSLKQANITLEKKVEERTHELEKAKHRAEESERLKTAFLHNISHEIRTPINGIIGFAELLGAQKTKPEKSTAFINIIIRSSYQLISIIEDIVRMSELETNQVKILDDEVEVNTVLNELLKLFRLQAKPYQLKIDMKTPLSNRAATIVTDKRKLTQVLNGLINNALKFTPKGSINFGYHLKEDFLEFFVSDTGIGIGKEVHNKVFDNFWQAEQSTTREFGGTGLGLSIAKQYVQLLGGTIWFDSQINKGTTFYFTIPYRPIN